MKAVWLLRRPILLDRLALLQATLGVWTLLLAVPIALGLAHQAGAILLFAAALYHLWLTLARGAPVRNPQTASSA